MDWIGLNWTMGSDAGLAIMGLRAGVWDLGRHGNNHQFTSFPMNSQLFGTKKVCATRAITIRLAGWKPALQLRGRAIPAPALARVRAALATMGGWKKQRLTVNNSE